MKLTQAQRKYAVNKATKHIHDLYTDKALGRWGELPRPAFEDWKGYRQPAVLDIRDNPHLASLFTAMEEARKNYEEALAEANKTAADFNNRLAKVRDRKISEITDNLMLFDAEGVQEILSTLPTSLDVE